MKCRLQFHLLLLGISGCSALVRPNLETDSHTQFLKQVLRNVNKSVNPCENFYDYACGKWGTSYNQSDLYLDMPGYMDYHYNKQLLAALTEHHMDGEIYSKLWAYYTSCRDVVEPNLNQFLHLLEPQLQLEWPIFRSNHSEVWRNETHFDWLGTLARLRNYGLNGVFISDAVNVRRENGSHYMLMLLPPLTADKALLQQNVESLYIAFGLEEVVARNLTQKLMQLEWGVGNLTQELAAQADGIISEWTLEQLQHRLPQLNWTHYLTNRLNHQPDGAQLYQVSAWNASYLEQLQLILSRTSNETICYYLMFKVLYQLAEELPVGQHETRAMSCVLQLRGHMPLAMNYVYETCYYSKRRQQTDAALQQLQLQLRAEFERLLQENYLQLTEVELNYLLEELRSLRLKIGNLPPGLSMEQLQAYYQELQLQPSDFYGNKLQLLKFYERLELRNLANKLGLWSTHDYYPMDAVVARSSSPVKIFHNAVVLPHGYLQLPLYDAQLNEMLQHAQLGFILAHELQHAFDLFHIVYDARGNYNITGQALLQHFSNFTSCYTNAHNVADQLLSESMSDIVGLQLAYAAYFGHTARTAAAANPCPHEKLTEQQLFFINSVQFLCANMQQIVESTDRTAAEQDVAHGLHNERVNRNWPHHQHFAQAFNCTVGQAMHRTANCRLW